MATQNSVEYDSIANTPSAYAPLKPNQLGGRVRAAYFSLNTTSKAVGSTDTINLTKLPAGARIVGGKVAFGAMGGSATLVIGVAGTTNKYLASTSVVSAGNEDIASTIATNIGDELASETVIIGTAGGSAYASAQDLKGYILYIVD